METSVHQLPPGVTVRAPPPPPPAEPAVMNDEPLHQAASSPCAKHNSVRRLSITRDLSSFPEVDFPVKYVLLIFVLIKKKQYLMVSVYLLSTI
jgi:hypothetical protein